MAGCLLTPLTLRYLRQDQNNPASPPPPADKRQELPGLPKETQRDPPIYNRPGKAGFDVWGPGLFTRPVREDCVLGNEPLFTHTIHCHKRDRKGFILSFLLLFIPRVQAGAEEKPGK